MPKARLLRCIAFAVCIAKYHKKDGVECNIGTHLAALNRSSVGRKLAGTFKTPFEGVDSLELVDAASSGNACTSAEAAGEVSPDAGDKITNAVVKRRPDTDCVSVFGAVMPWKDSIRRVTQGAAVELSLWTLELR